MPLPLASIDKLMRKAGAHRVSEGAARELAEYLDKIAVNIAREAIVLSSHAKRKTVTAEDIRLAKNHFPDPEKLKTK